MSKVVMCSRLKQEAPALQAAPFPGLIGQEIFKKVSQEAWDEWQEMQIKVINEYHLDLSETADRQTLLKQMRTFLCLDEDGEVLKVGTPS